MNNSTVAKVIEDIKYLCQDVENWNEKHFLIPALISHLKKRHDSQAIDNAIMDCFYK